MKKSYKSLLDAILIWGGIIGILLIGASVCSLDYLAYKHRFPDAPAWTYLFQNK